MCKAPKPPAQKEPEKPEYLRNPYLDAAIGQSGAVDQMRTGRSALRTDIMPGHSITLPGLVPGKRMSGRGANGPSPDQYRGVLPGLASIRLAR